MKLEIYDIVGIGFGPANIAVAVALDEIGWRGSTLFLERAAGPHWQPGMLIDGADTQNHPLRDFVTPRNPRSKYGFLTYLHEHQRFFDYLNLGLHYPLRKDFAQYVQWVARQFDDIVAYSQDVTGITTTRHAGLPVYQLQTAAGHTVLARSLIFAPGRTPHIPTPFKTLQAEHLTHLVNYRERIQSFARNHPEGCVAVVGSSQSAVEIVLDIADRFDRLSVVNLVRGFGYQLKDTSPFSEHAYFPEFVDAFYGASEAAKGKLRTELWRSNYSSADADVINRLYLKLYEQKLDRREQVRLITQNEVVSARSESDGARLRLRHALADGRTEICAGLVILATGFLNFGDGVQQERYPALLDSISGMVDRRDDGSFAVGRDYRATGIDALPPLFINGLNESTHGFGDAGSFSLLSLRAWHIVQAAIAALQATGAQTPERALS
ncbi:MAG: SidA/IucD/PvdA family monooxygenase [Burkholderiaceae bacterium]|jgi:L-ornithine N5-oxygenase|nr:SidA/IucD/PvdA family monooxygenase [Burkholderiaceae bacterium]